MIIDKNWYSVNDTIVVFYDGEDEVETSLEWTHGIDIKILITKHIEDLYALPSMLLAFPFKKESKEYNNILEAISEDTKLFIYKENDFALDKILKRYENYIIKRRCKELFQLRDCVDKEPDKYVFLDCEPEYMETIDETIRWGMLLKVREVWIMSGQGEMIFEGVVKGKEEKLAALAYRYIKDKWVIGLNTVDSYCQLTNYLESFNYKINVKPPIYRIDKILASFLSKDGGHRSISKYFGDVSNLEELYKSFFKSSDKKLIDNMKKYFGG